MDDRDRLRHLADCDRRELAYWKGAIEALIVRDEEESKKPTNLTIKPTQ